MFSRILKLAVILGGVFGSVPITARELYENNNVNRDSTDTPSENSFSVSSTFIKNELHKYNQAMDALDDRCMLRAQIASEYAESVCLSNDPEDCIDEKAADFFLQGNAVAEIAENAKALEPKKARIQLIDEATQQNITRLLHEPLCLPTAQKLLEEKIKASQTKNLQARIEQNLKVSKLWKTENPAKGMKLSIEEKQKHITTKYAVIMPATYVTPKPEILRTLLTIEIIPLAAAFAPAVLLSMALTSPAWMPFLYFFPGQTIDILENMGFYYIADKSIPNSMGFYNDLAKAKSDIVERFQSHLAADQTHRDAIKPDPSHVATEGFVWSFEIFLEFMRIFKAYVNNDKVQDKTRPNLGDWWSLKSDVFDAIVYLALWSRVPRNDLAHAKKGIGNIDGPLPARIDFSNGVPPELVGFGRQFVFGLFGHKYACAHPWGSGEHVWSHETRMFSTFFQNLYQAKTSHRGIKQQQQPAQPANWCLIM